jgi:hypothetical protein
MPRIKRKKRRREIKYLVGSIFPTILEPVDFIGFISWSYDFKSICLVKLCQSFSTKEFHFKVFGLLNYANILKQKGDSYVFSHYVKKVYGWLNCKKN